MRLACESKTLLLASCGSYYEDDEPSGGSGTESATVVSVDLSPDESSIPIGLTQQFTVTATLSDGTIQDVTADKSVTWASDNEAVATVVDGTSAGLSVGDATITASGRISNCYFSETAALNVTDAVVTKLSLHPPEASIPLGLSIDFKALAKFFDGQMSNVTDNVELNWKSDDETIATIGKGTAQAIAKGTTTITASAHNLSASAEITVIDAIVKSLVLAPEKAISIVGMTQNFTATATLSDSTEVDVTASNDVRWSSSDEDVATVRKGKATALRAGTTTIGAAGKGVKAEAELSVIEAVIEKLAVTPKKATVPVGLTTDFTATLELSIGEPLDVTNNDAVIWTAAEDQIASIETGRAKGLAVGETTVTATGSVQGKTLSDDAALTVTDAIITELALDPETVSLPVGKTQLISVTATMSDGKTDDLTEDKTVTWKSSDDKIASVDDKGTVTAVLQGEATITATAQDVPSTMIVTVIDPVVTEMAVAPESADIPLGRTQDFTATATLSDNTTPDVTQTARWTSEDEDIVTVDKGIATAVSKGSATITATDQKISASAQITIIDAIVKKLVLDPRKASQPVGLPQDFVATATMSDNTTTDVTKTATWSSSDETVATVENGTAQTLKKGTTTITAVDTSVDPNVEATAELSVIDAVVMQLAIDPKLAYQPAGVTQHFNVTATMSDGSTTDVTDSKDVSWESSDEKIVTVANGLATAVAKGSATITATDNEKSDTADFTVLSPITAIEIIPKKVSVTVNQSFNFTAIATLSDGSKRIVTQQLWLSWQSDNDKVSMIAKGKATGISVGTSTLTFSCRINGQDFSADAEFNVLDGGSVVAWGYGGYGGDSGAVQDQLVDVISITSNYYAFAAIKSDGSVVTWGESSHGGDSSSVQAQLVDVIAISANGYAFAATKSDGSVVVWGSGSAADSSDVQDQLSDVISISGTYDAYAALKSDGTVVTWGDAEKGGDSNSVQPKLINVISISANYYAFAAIKSDGSVVTWGDSRYGGDSSAVQDQLVDVISTSDTQQAFAALKSDGSVVTWGEGSGGDSSVVQDQLVDVISLSSSKEAFAALRSDGSVVTWGNAQYGADSSAVQEQLKYFPIEK